MGYSIDVSQSIWWVTFSETLTSDDLLKLLEEARRVETSVPVVANRLIDFRNLKTINIVFAELSGFASGRRKRMLANSIKSAIVTSQPVQLGFARMFQTLLGHPQINVKIYDNEKDALGWLAQK